MKDTTGFLPLRESDDTAVALPLTLTRCVYGAVTWPWLLRSLWGGTQASKTALLNRLGLRADALPNLGSWKADTHFLHRIVDAIEELRPKIVVELGAGATTLVTAKALSLNGGGRLISFDQNRNFIASTADWLAENGCGADLRWAPLTRSVPGWPGNWYATDDLPHEIDLLLVDGPPWTVHPRIRGAAECLFDRLSPQGMVLLDDAFRPGERIVAWQWRNAWPNMQFDLVYGGSKGTLVGRRI